MAGAVEVGKVERTAPAQAGRSASRRETEGSSPAASSSENIGSASPSTKITTRISRVPWTSGGRSMAVPAGRARNGVRLDVTSAGGGTTPGRPSRKSRCSPSASANAAPRAIRVFRRREVIGAWEPPR